jgi:hypothetical protein
VVDDAADADGLGGGGGGRIAHGVPFSPYSMATCHHCDPASVRWIS